MKKRILRVFLALTVFILLLSRPVRADEAELYQNSGADTLMEALPEEAQSLLQNVGADPMETPAPDAATKLFSALSEGFRAEWTAPARALLTLLASCVLCRLVQEFAAKELSYAVSVHEACAHRDDRDLDDGYGPGRAQKRKKDAYAEHRQAGKVQPLWAHFPLHEDEPQRNQAQRRPPAQKKTDGGGDPLTRLADCHFHSGGERNDARGEHLLPLGDEEAESDAVGRVAGFAGD